MGIHFAIRPPAESAGVSRSRRPLTFQAGYVAPQNKFELKLPLPGEAGGGKLIVWHGWADGAIMATSSIGYYEGVLKSMGGRKQTEDFFRLFLVPGVPHSGGGPGFTEFDSMTALETWVERGQAPNKFIACRATEGAVERCRPIFPYPVHARCLGKGDPKLAESFVPLDPTEH